jgi:hypothetical protein
MISNHRKFLYVKRFHQESIELLEKCKNMVVEYTFENKKQIIVRINLCEIIISEGYPFTKPNIMINNRKYNIFLGSPSQKITFFMHKIYGKCICCESIMSPRNMWLPTNRIVDILNEINTVNLLKRKIKYNIILPEITIKYNIPEDLQKHIYQYLCE